tara:strand:+ start:28377 stop:28802 length:426 start_codon:yes stop_codon:yes gene_type:complete
LKKNKWFVIYFLFFTITVIGQNLEQHQWVNRVLLIFSDDKKDERLIKQIEVFSQEKQSLAERKLLIYHFSENQFTPEFNTVWFSSTLKTKKYKRKSENFKVVLIGLDGGIKLEQTSLLSTEKLFAIIDGMPMRRREIKTKN